MSRGKQWRQAVAEIHTATEQGNELNGRRLIEAQGQVEGLNTIDRAGRKITSSSTFSRGGSWKC
jgi:hypothetical protein